jgi:hypothetical protein
MAAAARATHRPKRERGAGQGGRRHVRAPITDEEHASRQAWRSGSLWTGSGRDGRRRRRCGIRLMTPTAVHYGHAEQLHSARTAVLTAAYARNPERFVRKQPVPPQLPTATWINKAAPTRRRPPPLTKSRREPSHRA